MRIEDEWYGWNQRYDYLRERPARRGSATAERFAALPRRYDLRRWRFTGSVRIEDGVIPRSHPVLTINTRRYEGDGPLLSTYLHEHLHWFLGTHMEGVARAIAARRRRYPDPPVGYPDGAQDAYSSYAHYIICYLEWRALLELTGEDEATRVFAYWRGDHYRAIYTAVMDGGEALGALVMREVGAQ